MQDFVVEVDIVMASNTPLWKAHDMSQALQDKLEEMPRVSRCHIHVDYETTYKPYVLLSLLFLSRLCADPALPNARSTARRGEASSAQAWGNLVHTHGKADYPTR